MSIRGAIIEDLPDVMILADMMFHESRYSEVMDFDTDKVAGLLTSLIAGRDGVLLVAEIGGEVVGLATGWITQSTFSKSLIFGEYGIYMHPDHRGGMTGPRLVKAWRDWGHAAGAVEGLAAITTGVLTDETSSMYEICGGRKLGPVFVF
jgi:GNAT superfamily N-acetyltransferase